MSASTALLALGVVAAIPAGFGQAVSLSVSQIWTSEGAVNICLYPRAADGLPGKLAQPSVTATAAGQTLQVQSVAPFETLQEGVGYLLLADISKSLSSAEFQSVRQAMASFAQGLRANDRMAILTFGDEVKVTLDFSSDRAAIDAAIQSLAPSDNQTKLHLAVSRAIELGQRQDAGLPSRRAIVLLTDGKDEGSGLSPEDLLAGLRAARLPIYAIGASRLPAAEKKQYLDWLRRLAANSGGEYFDASAAFTESYETIRRCVMGVLLARFTCAGCQSGKPETWNITVKDGDKVLTATMDYPLPSGQPSNPDPISQQSAAQPQPAASQAQPVRVPVRLPWMPIGGGAVAALIGILAIVRRKRAQTVVPPSTLAAVNVEATASTPSEVRVVSFPPTPAVQPKPVVVQAPVPFAAGLPLQLVVVRGNRPGQTHDLRLEGKAKVGTAACCDLVLRSEPSLAAEHFELTVRTGKVSIRGLSAAATNVNGIPIHGEHPVRDGDIIGAGGAEFRILVRPS